MIRRTAITVRPTNATSEIARTDARDDTVPQRPRSQAPNATAQMAASSTALPLGPVWICAIQSSQAVAANRGNANSCFIVSIQRPGFGIRFASDGKSAKATSGTAAPAPKAANVASPTVRGAVSAPARVAPKNGAVQGVPTRIAAAPVVNAPTPGSTLLARLSSHEGQRLGTSKTPRRLSAAANVTRATSPRKRGDCI